MPADRNAVVVILALVALLAVVYLGNRQASAGTVPDGVLPVTEADFAAEVTGAAGLVLVDFWSETCPPCVAMKPDLAAFATAHAEQVKVVSVHAYDQSRLTMAHDVRVLPTLVLYKDGSEVARTQGRQSHADLRAFIAGH